MLEYGSTVEWRDEIKKENKWFETQSKFSVLAVKNKNLERRQESLCTVLASENMATRSESFYTNQKGLEIYLTGQS